MNKYEISGLPITIHTRLSPINLFLYIYSDCCTHIYSNITFVPRSNWLMHGKYSVGYIFLIAFTFLASNSLIKTFKVNKRSLQFAFQTRKRKKEIRQRPRNNIIERFAIRLGKIETMLLSIAEQFKASAGGPFIEMMIEYKCKIRPTKLNVQ